MRSVEEEQGRAQSKPTHASGHSEQVRHRAAPTFQSGFYFLKACSPFSVPLEELNLKTESLRFASPGAHTPQIDGQLACHRHNSFFAGSSGGNRASALRTAFGKDLPPFDDRLVIRLEADQSPGQFHQGSAQAWVTVFGHAALQPGIATRVLARAKTGVAGNLTTIIEPAPIADLPIDHYTGHFSQTARLVGSGSALQLQRHCADLFLEGKQNGLAV